MSIMSVPTPPPRPSFALLYDHSSWVALATCGTPWGAHAALHRTRLCVPVGALEVGG